MLQQNLINTLTLLPVVIITGLFLAWPARLIIRGRFGGGTGYWKAYFLTCLIDGAGHIGRIIILTLMGSFAPAVSNLWGSWAGNGALLLAAGWLVFMRCMKDQEGKRPSPRNTLMASVMFALMILVRDAALFLIVFHVMTSMQS